MIKFRNSVFESHLSDRDVEIIDGETLDSAIKRIFENIDLGKFKVQETFVVLVNGKKVDYDFWPFVKLTPTDEVVLHPDLQSGESGQIFKQIAIIAITIVASVVLSPAVGGGIGGALAAAGATIAATLILNALIPPPVAGADSLGVNSSYGDSQMYAISGQSNQVKKFATVPKIYGRHRFFPPVAANPYTELETDSEGKLSQFLYAVYDLGLGPLRVEDIRIGDTPIDSFADTTVNLIDFNKPDVVVGAWDDVLKKDLVYYKGDRQIDTANVALNNDSYDNVPESTYKVTRLSSFNTTGAKSEVTLSFVNPSGLYTYSNTGAVNERKITLEIIVQRVGAEAEGWFSYNDSDYMEYFSSAGGNAGYFQQPFNAYLYPAPLTTYTPGSSSPRVLPIVNNDPSPYAVTAEYQFLSGFGDGSIIPVYNPKRWRRELSVPAGATRMLFRTDRINYDGGVAVGKDIRYNGTIVAKIASFTTSSYPNYSWMNFEAPLTTSLLVSVQQSEDKVPFSPMNGEFGQVPAYSPAYNNYTIDLGAFRSVSDNASLTVTTVSPGRAQIVAASTSAVYSTFKFAPRIPGQYRIQITRLYTEGDTTTHQDNLTFAGVSTRFDTDPIVTTKRHVFLEVRIKATNQLSGAIQNLSAVCTSVLDVYDPVAQTWTPTPTQNPAWVFCDLLTGQVNKRAIDKSRLHMESILEWADYCDEIPDSPAGRAFAQPRFQSNFVLDYEGTLQSVAQQVTTAAQASLNVIDGKYGSLLDVRRTTPVQIFTPRNSRDFTSSRNYAARPDGVSINFIDPGLDWATSQIVAYDNGFNEGNALNIEELTAFGVTNEEQAWRFGRYMIAQNRLRQETMSLLVDFEHLVCTRGDFVQITQDVMRVGGKPARVKTVVGNRITIDDAIEAGPPLSYGYVYRNSQGGIETSTLTVVFADTFDLNGLIPAVGDLIVIGEVGKIVFDCVVKSISPNDDLSAQLILVEKADAIYDYESTDTFTDYDPQLSVTSNPEFSPPGAVEDLVIADNAYECDSGGYRYYIMLDWDAPSGSAYETFQVFVDTGKGYFEVAQTRASLYKYIVDATDLGVVHNFKVIAVSATGKKLDLASTATITATPVTKTLPPSNIDRLTTDITGEVLQLTWTPILDCDLAQYVIRYSPSLDASWESSITLLKVSRNVNSAATQARTGTYLIKAIDFNGNESTLAEAAITTIPQLFNLNVIEEITDSPSYNGTLEAVEKFGTSLILDTAVVGGVDTNEFYAEGYYYYESLLDLSEIYSVRLQSLIQAEGYTLADIMGNWATLDSVDALSNAGYGDWDVETQYRSTNDLVVMETWPSLSSVGALNSGSDDQFSPWRKFIMGDATGRIFQFRLKLISNDVRVSPRVFDALIRADMPDRVESYNNLTAPSTGAFSVMYAPSFAGPGTSPNVQITLENGQSGDYWAFGSRTLDGFSIRFYDKNGLQVSRQFDAVAKGYGRKALSSI